MLLLRNLRRLFGHIVATFISDKEVAVWVKELFKYGYIKKQKDRYKAKKMNKFKYNLSVLAIMKNEGFYLREWIEYYKLMGVEKIFLYDNGSTDNTKEILKPYIETGVVEYVYFPGQKMQVPAYNDWLKKHMFDTKWLAVVDLDEFIIPMQHNNITEYLETVNKDICQINISWVVFGSNGHKKRPNGLVLENYTKCASEKSNSFKSIIRPYQALKMGVHGHTVAGKTKKEDINIIRTNHYYVKSFEDYLKRASRGDVFYGDEAAKRLFDISKFKQVDKNEVYDDSALKFVPELKRILNK